MPKKKSINTVAKENKASLVALGVPKELLKNRKLDFALLYQRLRFLMNPIHFDPRLQCEKLWQIEALAGPDFSYIGLDYDDNNYFDNWKARPIHYVAFSGNLKILRWVHAFHPQHLIFENDFGATPIHYAAFSGDLKILEWIYTSYLKSYIQNLTFEDDYSRTPIHYAAWSGNPNALDWIEAYYSDNWITLLDNFGRAPIHYAAFSGNPKAVKWINMHHPEYWSLMDEHGRTTLQYTAASGNSKALNLALLGCKNPQSLTFMKSDEDIESNKDFSKVFIQTWIKTLKTYYNLIQFNLNNFPIDEDSHNKIKRYILRNNEIRRVKLQITAFMQGVFWPGSKISSLNVDICSHILAQLLPNKVKVEPIHKVIENYSNPKLRALKLINIEIQKLKPSLQKNTFFGGDSRICGAQIKTLAELHALIENGSISNAQFSTWEAKRRSILGKESSFCNFNDEGLTTQKTIEDVKQILRV